MNKALFTTNFESNDKIHVLQSIQNLRSAIEIFIDISSKYDQFCDDFYKYLNQTISLSQCQWKIFLFSSLKYLCDNIEPRDPQLFAYLLSRENDSDENFIKKYHQILDLIEQNKNNYQELFIIDLNIQKLIENLTNKTKQLENILNQFLHFRYESPLKSAITPTEFIDATFLDNIIISYSKNNNLTIWNTNRPNDMFKFLPHEAPLLSVKALEKGTFLTSANDKTIKLWSVYPNDLISVYNCNSPATALEKFNQDMFISGHINGEIQLWTRFEIGPLKLVSAHQLEVTQIELVKDKNLIISNSFDKSIKIWGLDQGINMNTEIHCMNIIEFSSHIPKFIILPNSEEFLCLTGLKKTVKYNYTQKHMADCFLDDSQILSISPSGRLMMSLPEGNRIQILLLEIKSSQLYKTYDFNDHLNGLSMIHAYFITDDSVICTYEDNSMKIWNLNTSECIRKMVGHNDSFNGIEIIN